jgi:hypothetical protein
VAAVPSGLSLTPVGIVEIQKKKKKDVPDRVVNFTRLRTRETEHPVVMGYKSGSATEPV